MVTVKICGVRDPAGAAAVRDAGADFAGLLFVEGRRRAVRPNHAASLLPALGTTEPVGVFLDMPVEPMLDVLGSLGLDWVQLHGREPPAVAARLAAAGLRVIRALAIGDGGPTWPIDSASIDEHRGFVQVFLLDGFEPGSGREVPPERMEQALRLARASGVPVWRAGGLDSETVAGALGPDVSGVDAASGVERNGDICPARAAAFVSAAKRKHP